MRFFRQKKGARHSEAGTTLVEAVVALAILATVAIAFIGGIISTSRAALQADKQVTALSIAQNQMEWAKSASYVSEASQYSTAPIPDGDAYRDYTANISAEPLNSPDDGIQRITVTVSRFGNLLMTLEGYKADR